MNTERFLTHLQTAKYSDCTIRAYSRELGKFETFLKELKLRVNQVKGIHIERYLRWRDPNGVHKAASTRVRLAVIGSFYDYTCAMANGFIRNPVDSIRAPRRQSPRPTPLTEEEVSTLRDGIANSRDQAILGLLLYSGLRLSELCSLNLDSIRVEYLAAGPTQQVVGVGRVIGKGSKEREFLVDLATLKLIHRYISERQKAVHDALFLSNRMRRINPRTIQHMLHTWCRRLGLPSFHPHQMRSTFATRLQKVGVPTQEISKLLGHASLETTMIYIQPDARKLRAEYFAAMEALNPQMLWPDTSLMQ